MMQRGGIPKFMVLSMALPAVAFMVFLIWPVWACGCEGAHAVGCMSNLKQTALGSLMYATDNDERLPLASNWADSTLRYVKGGKEEFRCTEFKEDRTADEFGHAFWRSLGGVNQDHIEDPVEAIMQFDSDDFLWNANGDFDQLPPSGRHKNDRDSFAFADGHVKTTIPLWLL